MVTLNNAANKQDLPFCTHHKQCLCAAHGCIKRPGFSVGDGAPRSGAQWCVKPKKFDV